MSSTTDVNLNTFATTSAIDPCNQSQLTVHKSDISTDKDDKYNDNDTYDNNYDNELHVNVDNLDDDEHKYLEGGFGWVVVAATTILSFNFLGLLYQWGIVQSELERQGMASSSTLAFIGALASFFPAFLAIPSAALVRKFGHFKVSLAGSLFVGLGELISGFTSSSLACLFIFNGVFLGVGGSLCFLSTCDLPSTYFKRKRALTTGIFSSGGGIGGAVYCILSQKLINSIGLPWTFRILGIISLSMMIPSCFFLKPGIPSNSNTYNNRHNNPLSTLRSIPFALVAAACFIVSFAIFMPSFFVPLYVKSIGLSSQYGAIFTSVFNLASAAGRLGYGALADFVTGNVNAFILSTFSIGAGSLFIWPFTTNVGPLSVVVIAVGSGVGGFIAQQPSLCGQILGTSNISHGIGIIESVEAAGFLLGPFVSGLMLDTFGGPDGGHEAYRPSLYFVGSTSLFSACVIILARFTLSRKLLVRV